MELRFSAGHSTAQNLTRTTTQIFSWSQYSSDFQLVTVQLRFSVGHSTTQILTCTTTQIYPPSLCQCHGCRLSWSLYQKTNCTWKNLLSRPHTSWPTFKGIWPTFKGIYLGGFNIRITPPWSTGDSTHPIHRQRRSPRPALKSSRRNKKTRLGGLF